MSDLISRQKLIESLQERYKLYDWDDGGAEKAECGAIIREIFAFSSAEPLTDAEQRIFLKAISREEEVCKIVDEEYKDEGYKLNLVHACHEIERKVKGVLWT